VPAVPSGSGPSGEQQPISCLAHRVAASLVAASSWARSASSWALQRASSSSRAEPSSTRLKASTWRATSAATRASHSRLQCAGGQRRVLRGAAVAGQRSGPHPKSCRHSAAGRAPTCTAPCAPPGPVPARRRPARLPSRPPPPPAWPGAGTQPLPARGHGVRRRAGQQPAQGRATSTCSPPVMQAAAEPAR
jgi:hypothetical protein